MHRFAPLCIYGRDVIVDSVSSLMSGAARNADSARLPVLVLGTGAGTQIDQI